MQQIQSLLPNIIMSAINVSLDAYICFDINFTSGTIFYFPLYLYDAPHLKVRCIIDS